MIANTPVMATISGTHFSSTPTITAMALAVIKIKSDIHTNRSIRNITTPSSRTLNPSFFSSNS